MRDVRLQEQVYEKISIRDEDSKEVVSYLIFKLHFDID